MEWSAAAGTIPLFSNQIIHVPEFEDCKKGEIMGSICLKHWMRKPVFYLAKHGKPGYSWGMKNCSLLEQGKEI